MFTEHLLCARPFLVVGDTAVSDIRQAEMPALVEHMFSWRELVYKQNKLVDNRAYLKVTSDLVKKKREKSRKCDLGVMG